MRETEIVPLLSCWVGRGGGRLGGGGGRLGEGKATRKLLKSLIVRLN